MGAESRAGSQAHADLVAKVLGASKHEGLWARRLRRRVVAGVRARGRAISARLLRSLGGLPVGTRQGAVTSRLFHGIVARLAVAAGWFDRESLGVLLGALESHKIAFDVLTSSSVPSGTARSVLDQLSELPTPLRAYGAMWLRGQRSLEDELPLVVYTALALDGPASLGNARIDLVFSLMGPIAVGLTEPQAVGLVSPLWALASTPVDPYSPHTHRAGATGALVELAVARQEVLSHLLDRLPHFTGGQRQLALDILARSIRAKGQARGRAFMALVPRLGLSNSEWTRFCAIADARQRISAPRASGRARVKGSRLRRAGTLAWRGLLVGIAPAVVMATWGLSRRTTLEVPFAPAAAIPMEVGIALIALIATINVFTVQLSTTRLPGTVARVSGQPWQLAAAYAGALSVVALVILEPDPVPEMFRLGEAVLVLSALGWLGGALVGMFRRTDPADACGAYVRRNIHRWNRTGRRFGRAQWTALQLSRAVDALPFTGGSVQREMISSDLVRFEAPQRGILLPSRRRLATALADAAFDGDGYLQFTAGFGILVSEGETIALLRQSDPRVAARLEKALRKALRPLPAEDVENVSTQAVTLAALALEIAGSGDTRLAEAVAGQASAIVASHLASVQRSRSRAAERARGSVRDADRDEATAAFPIVPALKDLLRLLVAHLEGPSDVTEVAEGMLDRCLAAAGPGERVSLMLAGLIWDRRAVGHEPDRAPEWLRRAGVRALECGDDLAFQHIVRRLMEVAEVNIEGVRAASSLCAASVRLRPGQFEEAWGKVEEWAGRDNRRSGTLVSLALHVGASALDCGGFSAGLVCARALSTAEQRATLAGLTSLDNVFGQSVAAQLWHIDVGDVPTDQLEFFRDLVLALPVA